MTRWEAIKAAWAEGWRRLAESARGKWDALFAKDPGAAKRQVEGFSRDLAETRRTLDRMRERLPARPAQNARDQRALDAFDALERRYNDLAAGFYPETRDATKPTVGAIFVPILVLAGVLAVSKVGADWALAAQDYAQNLREQTALADKELGARVEASREGRPLQDSTLPKPPPAPPKKDGHGWLIAAGVAGVAVVGTLLLLPQFVARRGA